MEYQDYLETDYWKLVSKAVKSRAGWKCQLCNSPHDLSAHHRTYEHKGSEMEHLDDLTCLCRRCHALFHGKQEQNTAPVKAKSEPNRSIQPKPVYDHVSEMPTGDPIVITRQLVKKLKTKAGGYTAASLRPLGLRWPLRKGWARSIIGQSVSAATYLKCLEGRSRRG